MNPTDPFIDHNTCVDRLLADYDAHNNLIIALDFDNTIYDYHKKGYTFPWVIEIIKECNELNLSVVIYTAFEDHTFVKNYCKEIGIEIKGVNEQLIPLFKNAGKLYYNILLDDRAGLSSALLHLQDFINIIKVRRMTNDEN